MTGCDWAVVVGVLFVAFVIAFLFLVWSETDSDQGAAVKAVGWWLGAFFITAVITFLALGLYVNAPS